MNLADLSPGGSYNNLDKPRTRMFIYPNADTDVVAVGYDLEGENSLTVGGTALVDAVGYNVMGQIVKLDMNGSIPDTLFAYHPKADVSGNGLGDSNFRLKTIQHGAAGSGNALPDLSFEYDRVGNITKLTAISSAGTDIQEFQYDALNRLQSASATGGVANYSHLGVPGVVDDGYDYDKLGNITSAVGVSYGYNDGAHKQAVTHLGGVQKFEYDANGNMTERIEGSVTYEQGFDVENRLISVTPLGGTATTFAYDASGQRVMTVEPAGKTTYFPFPGYSEEMVGTAVTTRRVTYTIAGQAVASRVQILFPTSSNTLYRLYTDHLGSTVTQSTMSGGTVAGTNTYYLPYGSYRGTPPTQTLTDRDFTGQRENREIGLLYYNARFYHPASGRFISPDTLIPDPTNPQSFNRYTYVFNRPTYYNDQSGHCPWCIGAIIGGVVGGGMDYFVQARENRAMGMSWGDAIDVANIDLGRVAGATVAGAIVGGTFGAVGAVAGAGYGTMAVAGGISNAVAGQAEAVTDAAVDQWVGQSRTGASYSWSEVVNDARDLGLGNPVEIGSDAVIGAVGGVSAKFASNAMTNMAKNVGWLPKNTIMSGRTNEIRYLPDPVRGTVMQVKNRVVVNPIQARISASTSGMVAAVEQQLANQVRSQITKRTDQMIK